MMTQTTPPTDGQTEIYKLSRYGEIRIGFVDGDGSIFRLKGRRSEVAGRVELRGEERRIFRKTLHDERELGTVDTHGGVRSHGLFEGGELGWLDPDGVVIQGGLILGEEEVGRVEGPDSLSAAGALLLLFLPEDAEADRDMQRRER